MKIKLTLLTLLLFGTCFIHAQTTILSGIPNHWGINLNGNDLYISQPQSSSVTKINVSDLVPSQTTVLSGSLVYGTTIKDNFMYYCNLNTGVVSKIDITVPSPTPQFVVSGVFSTKFLFKGNELFFADYNTQRIVKINITDPIPTLTTVVTGVAFSYGLAFKNDDLYISNYTFNRIVKVNTAALIPTLSVVVTGVFNPVGLEFKDNDLYIAEAAAGKISKINILDVVPTLTDVITTLSVPVEIEISNNDLYIGDAGAGTILKLSIALVVAGETNVQASQCGVTLPNYNSIVYANLVAGAERYRFRVTNLLTNVVVEKEYVLRNLYMNSLSNFQYNQQYSVEVAVRKAGVWLPYGSSCNITTANATTKVVASQCGTTLTARSNFVYADIVSLASGYRFRVTNLSTSSVQLIDRTLRTFTFNMVTDYQDATAYTVEVAAKNTNGVYLAFGDVCTIFTPGIIIPERQINTKDDGNYNFVATGYPNPFENSFKVSFDSNSLSTVTIVVYDMLGKQVEYREVKSDDLNNIDLGSTLNSGVYNIIVSQDETIHSMRMVKR